MIMLFWPLVLTITGILYGFIILTLPFNPQMATIFLFALIAFWSRLPGVGIYNPFYFLYRADLVDIFTIVIAMDINPLYAMIFCVFCNLASRACGVFPDWPGVVQDSILQASIAPFVPIFAALSGGNIVTVVLIFSFFNQIGFFFFWFIWPRRSFIEQVITTIVTGAIVLFINNLYARYLGGFIDDILAEGVAFNWLLFLFVTVVIATFYLIVFGFGHKPDFGSYSKVLRRAFRGVFTIKPQKTNSDDEMDYLKQIRKEI